MSDQQHPTTQNETVIVSTSPMTISQQALWMIHKKSPGTGVYNCHFVWSIPEYVRFDLLEQVLQLIADRHPAIRTLYRQSEEGELEQCVCDSLSVPFEIKDVGNLDDDALQQLLDVELKKDFDLENEMSMRWVVLKRENHPNVLIQFVHHIGVDLWSAMILFNELRDIYHSLSTGQQPELPEIESTFDEFVDQQTQLINSEKGEKLSRYWKDRLGDAPQALDIQLDHARPVIPTYNRGYYRFRINSDVLQNFNQLAKRKRTSLFAQYLLAYQVLLSKYSGQTDIVVGGPTGGRGEDEYEGVYGYFTNAVAFRAKVLDELSFSKLIEVETPNILAALESQEYPFPLVAEFVQEGRENKGIPVVQASFIWENTNRFVNRDVPMVTLSETGHQLWDMGDMGTWVRHIRHHQIDDFDLTLKIYKYQSEFIAAFEYCADLYDQSTVERMAKHYETLLETLVEQPDVPIGQLALVGEQEKRQLLIDWNKTQSYYNPTMSMPQYVEKYAASQPDSLAVTYQNQTLSYKALDERSNQLANYLRQQSVGKEDIVGVYLDRSPDVIVAIIGIMKAGAAYLPLDPEYPSDRISYIIGDASPKLILTQKSLQESVTQMGYGGELLTFGDESLNACATDFHAMHLEKDQLAYIIYTSGSTGKPKGTMIEHGGLANLLHAKRKVYKLDPKDNVLQFASINFDASISEISAALEAGATLCMANKMDMLGQSLLSTLRDKHISWAVLPPAVLSVLEPDALPDLRSLAVAGDACSAELAHRWSKGRKFFNAYGPTETTIWATVAEVDGRCSPPIGKPVANLQCYILDAQMNPVPVGIPGELHVGGDGLARGYLNRPDLTAERFVVNPFKETKGDRLYKTGDLCRYLPNGDIEFLGRIDHQVKIRGFRVELGEIEAIIRQHEAAYDVLVMAREDFDGQTIKEKRLAAYVVKRSGEELDANVLREFVKARLPDYMVPSAFVVLDAFPMTPNEKVDRKALPIPSLGSARGSVHKLPRNEIERLIAKVWQQVLGVSEISVDENFFDLGGHSLLLAKAHSQLPTQLRDKVSLVDMFKYPTIQALAHYLEGDEEEDRIFIQPDDHAERLRLRRRLMDDLGGVQIAIVGMSGRFPGADNVEAFWQNICDKKEGITFFTPEQLRKAGVADEVFEQDNYVPAKGMLDSISEFEAPFFNFTPREAQITDPQQRLFLECSWEALEDAGCVPSEFSGRIGVYAGIGMNQYLMNHLSTRPDLLASVGDYPMMIGNDKDFLSTRVSYKLNLNGPAMVLQTACSTSLVAVHTACQALLSEDCDAALAGGVSFGRLGKTGYYYQQGMIMSADGHCRAFDEAATGTVQGQGCGVVLLKRLSDALESNDHIYAIISGSATNNDGSNKTGYTAPSIEGQAKAINMAQASSNIDPAQVTYVEAHGTGTPIGDPIEIEALTHAFNWGKSSGDVSPNGKAKQYCAIGSVKTNIGHLDAASGIVGLIKTAKALESKKLPPSLHFNKANPKIDFENSPFYVNTELKEWASDGPRYAGVSSFGIGGSNAHVVLTEPPEQLPKEKGRPWRIITLSARTPSALETMTEQFVEHLRTRKDQSFANMCYTLHVGRTDFAYRRYLVCRNRDEAISELSPVNPARVVTSRFEERSRKIVFMFSGQGSQYQNMGKRLYQVEPIFREAIDECRAILQDRFMFIYEELTEADYRGFSEKIHETYVTQPGLFIFEYALAKMLMAWGIKPDLMVGHSIGEYVAACLSGVFSLEEALQLVAIRGYLIHEQIKEKGEMLSVNLPESEAKLLTNHDVCIAAVNGESRCVLSGKSEAIRYLHDQLDAQGVENRILHTSHAFHSHMMEPILKRFTAYVERRQPNAPKIPFVSSRTGELITEAEATSGEYWAGHLRDTVRFHQALETVFAYREPGVGDPSKDESVICLEVGPGKVLTTLTKQHPGKQKNDLVMAVTRHALADISDTEHLLNLIARLWEQGIEIDWDTFHQHRQHYREPMPTYPFERKKHWVRPQQSTYSMENASELAENELEDTYEQPQDVAVGVVGPRNEVEKKVWQGWAQSLGQDDFGIHDDFFDLGGDSLLAVNLIDLLQRTFKIPLATHILIQRPTVADLSDYIRSNISEVTVSTTEQQFTPPENSPLVVIQQGDSDVLPLIMVHPIGGEVFFYRDLARYLGRQQPLYAFQALSLSGDAEPVTSVTTLALNYIAELKAAGVKPPYLLGGSSFGGLVAYEMAQKLSTAGEEVRLVTMVDTPAPEQMPKNLKDSAAILQYLLQDKIDLSLEQLRELDEKAQINYVLEQARSQGKGGELPPHLGVPLFSTWIAHQEATVNYEPQPYHGNVLFFRHTEPMKNFPALTHEPWKRLVSGNIDIHKVPGNHVTMNYAPHVKNLAKHLKPILAQAGVKEQTEARNKATSSKPSKDEDELGVETA